MRYAYYSPADVASIFGVTAQTVGHWMKEGRLPHVRSGPMRAYYPKAEIDALIAQGSKASFEVDESRVIGV